MKKFVSTYRSLLLLGVLIAGMVSSAFSEEHDGGLRILFFAHILLGMGGAYLLIALFWSNIYAAIEVMTSGSFQDPGGGALTRLDFLSFSLTSLTTLGYGDVLPITGPARIFSVLESVFGVLYVAIFVSSLVAMPEKRQT